MLIDFDSFLIGFSKFLAHQPFPDRGATAAAAPRSSDRHRHHVTAGASLERSPPSWPYPAVVINSDGGSAVPSTKSWVCNGPLWSTFRKVAPSGPTNQVIGGGAAQLRPGRQHHPWQTPQASMEDPSPEDHAEA